MIVRVGLGIVCLGVCSGPLGAQQKPPRAWPKFHAETLHISFRHPPTQGLRFETRAPTCTNADRTWQGSVKDSLLVVTRSAAPLAQVAGYLGMVRAGAGWVAEGYQGHRAPVASVRVDAWEALVAGDAQTVVYDMALRAPVTARQWRLVAMGPASDGCRPLLIAVVTGMAAVWDSSAVAQVLESASPRH